MGTAAAHATLFPKETDIPELHRLSGPIEQREYLAAGELRTWDGPVEGVLSPVCVQGELGVEQKLIGSYPRLTEREAMQALDAAVQAYDNGAGAWPTMSVEERIRRVEAFAVQMKARRQEVVKLLMWEIGKTSSDAQKEFDRTIDYIRDTVEALKELDRTSSRFVIAEGVIGQVRRAPLGVVLCMGPFNYPLNETFTTLIPALIMGNTVVMKPPKLGVLLHRPLLEAFRDCFPKGVVNTVYGDGRVVVTPMLASGKVDVLAFIGSSGVADILKRQHPRPHHLRSVLGLGAKNPAIVLACADLDLTVKECVTGALSYNGQRCTALKIMFVERSIASQFVERLSAAVGALKCGMPWDEGAQLTPLPEAGKPAWLSDLVKDACAKGARITNTDGAKTEHTFFHPAVVYPVSPTAKLYDTEQFGPIIPVVPFDDVREPVQYIVQSQYGQQASIFGTRPEVIAKLIDPLVNQVCRLNINSQCQRGPDTFPFAGRKASAEGTLSVSDALRVFAIRTMVAAKSNDLNKSILSSITHGRQSKFVSTDFIF